jgi:hypothetical protein
LYQQVGFLFRKIFRKLFFCFQEKTDFSDWSPWTDCIGIPCKTGHQQRIRACLKSSIDGGKKSICNGEQIQERDCSVPCSNKNSSSPSFSPVRPLSNGNNQI